MKNKQFLMNGIILAASIGVLGFVMYPSYQRHGPGHQEREIEFLKSKGFEDIKITGKESFCPRGTNIAAKFEATKNGLRQEGGFCHHSLQNKTTFSMK